MKKILCMIISVVLILFGTVGAAAENDISVVVNGKNIDFDVAPFIEAGRTMVPMRAIFEELGADVLWDAETKGATAERGEKIITFFVGSNEMNLRSGVCTMDVAPMILGDRTFIPLRAVSEAFDCNVSWNEKTKTVTVDDRAKLIDYEYVKETVKKQTSDENAVITVNYIYPQVTKGNDFLTQEDVEKLNACIKDEQKNIFNMDNYADTFAEDWPVIIDEKLFGYPDIVIDVQTSLYTSEKYNTVSLQTETNIPWLGALMNTVTLSREGLVKKQKLGECFSDRNSTQLYDEIFGEFIKNYEYVSYGRESFDENPNNVKYVISDNKLYVYMSQVLLTGVGRTEYYMSVVKEY